MPCRRLKSYLDEHGIAFETCRHSRAVTAQEIAARTHTKGRSFAKSVIVMLDEIPVMIVLPASKLVDLASIRRVVGSTRALLAGETEFRSLFPDCELGAMPPFGNLYGMEVIADETLPKQGYISFNSGTHSEIIRMKAEDFEALVQPRRIKLSLQPLHAG